MNNFWEQSNIQANCDLCGIDEPFFIPVGREDLINLRFIVPYHLVAANGGGLPIGAGVTIDIVNEIGTTVLCAMGAANSSNFGFGYLNLPTPKVAQYQFYIPQPFKGPTGINIGWAYINVNAGQNVVITGANTGANSQFTFGVDPLPASFYQVTPTRLVFPYNGNILSIVATLDGASVPVTLFLNRPTCNHENFQCFRVRLTINFASAGVTKVYYTKPMRVFKCEETIRLSASYPSTAIDCNGYRHTATLVPNTFSATQLYLRIVGTLNKTANKVKKTYNNKCFSIKSERTPQYKLNTPPVPEWFASEVENILLAKETAYDNMPLLLSDTENVFNNQEVNGYTYQHIDLTLQSCKCEVIFSC